MQSWNLKRFVDEYGVQAAKQIWDVSRQAVEKAIKDEREIQIIELDGYYEVHESKRLNRVSVYKAGGLVRGVR